MQKPGFSNALLALSCFGLLVAGTTLMGGCSSATKTEATEEKKEEVVSIEVKQLDQLSSMGEKTPDGQYLVAKVSLKNLGNETLAMAPTDFVLQNITKEEKEQYSQPIERYMSRPFSDTYGEALGSKLVDTSTINLYPRMQLERYFVFMVPSNAKIDGYQVTYVPKEVSAPLVVTGTTIINDHRNESELPAAE